MYICNQGLLSSTCAYCISCAPSAWSHCRRCCCCQLQCNRQGMAARLNSAEVLACTTDHDHHLSCIYSQHLLLHLLDFFFPSQEPPDTFLKQFRDDNKVMGIEVLLGDPRACVTRLQAQWWRAAGWVPSLGEHQPSLQTLHCTPHQHENTLAYNPWTSPNGCSKLKYWKRDFDFEWNIHQLIYFE